MIELENRNECIKKMIKLQLELDDEWRKWRQAFEEANRAKVEELRILRMSFLP